MKKDIDTKRLIIYTKDKDGNLSNEFLFDEEHQVSDVMKDITRKMLKEKGFSEEKIEKMINVMKT
jgi:hypothetical protein